MKLTVIGCGYLGAVHAAAMAELGHEVTGLDADADRVATLSAGLAPFHEAGLAGLLARHVGSGRLRFTTDPADAAGAAVHFLTVGTPQDRCGYGADLSQVEAATASLLPHLGPDAGGPRPLVVGKSTVPVGTAARLAGPIAAAGGLLAWNPEFVREGRAVGDSLEPDRIVYGLPPGRAGEEARRLLDEVYAPQLAAGVPRLLCDLPTAELVKVAANGFLATKISYINAMVDVCEAAGADVQALAEALGFDDRIGRRYLHAGVGFGGGCLPKDLRAFIARAADLGAHHTAGLLTQVERINAHRRDDLVERAIGLLGPAAVDSRVAILGASFKPGTDDLRDSPAVDVACRLQARGVTVRMTDPQAGAALLAEGLPVEVVGTPGEAAEGADLVLLLTEWPQYRRLDPATLAHRVRRPAIIDARNALDPGAWRDAGWHYEALGRGARPAATAPMTTPA